MAGDKGKEPSRTWEFDPELDSPPPIATTDKDVVVQRAPPALAYETFNGKEVHSANLRSQRDVYVNFQQAQTHFESPLERLQRLRTEIEQFQADVQALASTTPVQDVGTSNGVGSSLVQLEQGLGAVLGDPRIAPYLASDLVLGAAGVAPRQRQLAAAVLGAAEGGGAGSFTAELYAGADEDAALLDLGRRIDDIQRYLGTGNGDMHGELAAIQQKARLLDEHALEAVFTRTKTLLTDIEASEKSQAGGVSVAKLAELHALVTTWNRLTELVPQVVQRLLTQKEVHERHAKAVLREQQLTRSQASLASLLNDDKAMLQAALTGFQANLKLMQANKAALEARFAALEAKLTKM